MTECYCHQTTDGKVIICHIHYGRLMEDSSINYCLLTDEKMGVEVEELYGIKIIRTSPHLK